MEVMMVNAAVMEEPAALYVTFLVHPLILVLNHVQVL